MAIKMEHKPMTRGDEIRAMDDKALARFIMRIEELEGPQYHRCRHGVVRCCPDHSGGLIWIFD